MDSLTYAKEALKKAQALSPNDIQLQRQLFVIHAQELLRDIDWVGEASELPDNFSHFYT